MPKKREPERNEPHDRSVYLKNPFNDAIGAMQEEETWHTLRATENLLAAALK